MPTHRPRTLKLRLVKALIALIESLTLESLSKNQQTLLYIIVDLLLREVPSKVPLALKSLYKD
jgi:hypothetical protein